MRVNHSVGVNEWLRDGLREICVSKSSCLCVCVNIKVRTAINTSLHDPINSLHSGFFFFSSYHQYSGVSHLALSFPQVCRLYLSPRYYRPTRAAL